MRFDKYAPLLASSDVMEYQFDSVGPKGTIIKVVQFARTSNPDIFNLAFGNLQDGRLDEDCIVDNKDRNKILATVAATVYEFTATYPEKYIFFVGTTPQRSRLYRMAISINWTKLSADFDIYGVVFIPFGVDKEPFVAGKDYIGFLVKRKAREFVHPVGKV